MLDILYDCFFYYLWQTGDAVIAFVVCAPQG